MSAIRTKKVLEEKATMLKIIRANGSELGDLVPLFDAYRVFYQQESDKASAERFLEERLKKGQSLIFIAYWNGKAAGFTQLFTTYSSVSMKSFYILNDLFVVPEFRKKGIGEALLEKAKKHCQNKGYKGLALETAVDNPAQKLYEKLGWKNDGGFLHYFWQNPNIN